MIGLAPTAAAARVLREELGDSVIATDTLAKLVHALTSGTAVPDWVAAIGPGSLVIVDEAGMAGTLELATVIDYAVGRGASVQLVGDDRHLAAVGAGGLLRDIDRIHGSVTLSEFRLTPVTSVVLGEPPCQVSGQSRAEGTPSATVG